MLKKLRIRFTIICVLTTGIILSCLSAWYLYMSEIQVKNQSNTTFQNNINSIVYKLQSSKTIDNTWLSQLESGNMLIVHIEDNKKPLMFRGSWKPITDRNTLIERVQSKALEIYNFNIKSSPESILNISSVTFEIEGDKKEKYQAATTVIPSSNGWQSLTLLRDLRHEEENKFYNRLTFFIAVIIVMIILFIFSWWFAGTAIKPIEKSNQQQMEFVAAASHELRSPLAVLKASASAVNISNDKKDTEKFLSAINRECQRMSRLIDDLLLLASADAKTWSFQTERVEIETLLTNTYENFEHIAKKRNQTLVLDLPYKSIPIIQGDFERMEQAMSALLDNALFYTQDGGKITIGAYSTNRSIIIYVADNGIGISDENKEKIFQRFYRTDASHSKKEHYGLGLSVTSKIVKLHRGKVYVKDTNGRGSTFVIELPL